MTSLPRQQLTQESVPAVVREALIRLGANVVTARRRRGLSQVELAQKAGIAPMTLFRVERGSATTGIGAYFAALWALGLQREILNLASPQRDDEGRVLEAARLERGTARHELDDDF